jgi:exodeoxyribonuclease VII large subunit
LSCFNDEALVREIAASKIPVITGIGHEVDESLADLAADVRASTPSNAAEMLTRDKAEEQEKIGRLMGRARQAIFLEAQRALEQNRSKVFDVSNGLMRRYIEPSLKENREKMKGVLEIIRAELDRKLEKLSHQKTLVSALNPEKVLKQGYAILSGKISPGNVVKITTFKNEIEAEIKSIKERS